MNVLFFGCWGRVGHYLHLPNGRWPENTHGDQPWRVYDGALAFGTSHYRSGDARDTEQVEGLAKLHHKDGWTALAWWDRSVDERYGSNAIIFARGTFTFEEMLATGRDHFPSVFARFTYEIREAGGS